MRAGAPAPPSLRSGPHPPGHPLPRMGEGWFVHDPLPLAGEGGRRPDEGRCASTGGSHPLTFYSYYAYSPSARPAWGPGRDGGLGWGSSGGPAGRGKRTSGSRERNAGPRGHYDPRAFGQLAGRHCRFRSALRSAKIPPAAGAVWALSTSHLLSPRWAAPAPPSRALERQPPRRRPEPPRQRSPMSRRLKRLHPCRKLPAKPSFDLGPPSAYLSSRQLAG